MKKSIFIIATIAAVVLLSSFAIARNVNSNKEDNPVAVSANDGWEYYKTVTVYYKATDESLMSSTLYVFKKTVCGDPDYILSSSTSNVTYECSISKNYYYGRDHWSSQYKYTATDRRPYNPRDVYFNTYLQGWD